MLALKPKAFIAGISKNPAARKKIFIRFSINNFIENISLYAFSCSKLNFRAATAGKAGKVWSLPRFWVSIRSYKGQLISKCLIGIFNFFQKTNENKST